MKVHVVKSEDTWILKRVAESIRIPGITVGSRPDPGADINFFVSYQGWNQKRIVGSLCVPWMTHMPAQIDDGGWRRAKFRDAAAQSDYCVAMSYNTAKYCPNGSTAVWGGAVESRFVKPQIVVGVSAKISRRKGLERIEAMKAIPGVEIRVSGGRLSMSELVAWYKELDYLVVTSDTEGGPFSVIEAIASGVPVIAPDVGWCWEHPVIRYNGTTAGLVWTVEHLRPKSSDPWGTASVELEKHFEAMLAGKSVFPQEPIQSPVGGNSGKATRTP